MYPGKTVWDNKPDDGEPRFVLVGNASEAIARDPERYSLVKPPEPAPTAAPALPVRRRLDDPKKDD